MAYLFIYTILNAATSARGFQNIYRLEFLGVPVGILEALLVGGVILAFFGGLAEREKDPVDRTHPVYAICLVCLAIGFIFGVIGAFSNLAPLRMKLIFLREYFGMPAAVYTGYRLT